MSKNMKILYHEYLPFGPYVAKMEVDLKFCERLLKLGKTLKKKHNAELAGAIEHEYLYDLEKHPWIKEEFKICVNTWITGYKKFSGDPSVEPNFKLDPLWINFQKAEEYNPVHIHPGCHLSFVLYLEVPEEMLKEKVRTRGIPAGYTGLMYGEHSDLFCTIVNRVIKPKVGTLVMFPSNLKHFASHFESQGVTRTSVSGNIILISADIKEEKKA
tara:strand:- start:313 stop:954 length:642 start_codon:yes stop_codon:yes gene_type:complete